MQCFVLDLNFLFPWCMLICFWNQDVQQPDINIAFLLTVFAGCHTNSTDRIPPPYLLNQFKNVLFTFPLPIQSNVIFLTTFSPCSYIAFSPPFSPPLCFAPLLAPPFSPMGPWGTRAAHVQLSIVSREGDRRWVCGRRPWYYGNVKAHNTD